MATVLETKLMETLVVTCGGHSVDIVRLGEGRMLGWSPGVRGRDAIPMALLVETVEAGLAPAPGTIHADAADKADLARMYAEDGAFLSAARHYREIADMYETRYRDVTAQIGAEHIPVKD